VVVSHATFLFLSHPPPNSQGLRPLWVLYTYLKCQQGRHDPCLYSGECHVRRTCGSYLTALKPERWTWPCAHSMLAHLRKERTMKQNIRHWLCDYCGSIIHNKTMQVRFRCLKTDCRAFMREITETELQELRKQRRKELTNKSVG